MSEPQSWLQRHGSVVIAAVMLGGLVILLVLNAN